MFDKKNIILIFVFLAASVFAHGKNEKPVWVDNPSAVYPDALYMTATGGGKTRDQAENGAKGAMVSYFSQSIVSQITIVDTDTQIGRYSVQSSSAKISIEAQAALDKLIGVSIKATWNDTKKKTGWWALAVMEKAQGRESYTTELNKVVAEINLLIDISKGVSFDTISRCKTAKGILPRAEVYALILNLLNGPNRQNEIIQLAAKVDKTLTEARSIPVDVRVTGDKDGRFRAAFVKPFTDQGFRTGNRNSRFALEVKVSFETAPKNQYYNTRYTVDAILTDTQTGAELLTYNAADRESHPTGQADADNRAIIGALRTIEKEFPGVLQEFLDQQ